MSYKEITQEFNNYLIGNNTIRIILKKFSQLLCTQLSVDSCSIFLLNKSKTYLNLKSSIGEGLKRKKITISEEPDILFCLNTNEIVKKAYKSKNQYLFKSSQEFKGFAIYPITSSLHTYGVIILETKQLSKIKNDFIAKLDYAKNYLVKILQKNNILQTLKKELALKTTIKHKSFNFELLGNALNESSTIGTAYISNKKESWEIITPSFHNNREKELKRFEKTLEVSIKETIKLENLTAKNFIEADSSIFFAQLMFLEDKTLTNKIKNKITEEKLKTEYAVKSVIDSYIKQFKNSHNKQLQERSLDIEDIGFRLIKNLLDKSPLRLAKKEIILVTDTLTPSEIIKLPTENILGIVCEKGSKISHSAILAQSLNIPTILSVKNALRFFKNGDTLMIDGENERVIKNPTKKRMKDFYKKAKPPIKSLSQNSALTAKTLDNKKINVFININLAKDLNKVDLNQIEGVGLYRSEFMFMMGDSPPSENEQKRIYSYLASKLNKKPLTIRTLDFNRDKTPKYLRIKESTPSSYSISMLLETQIKSLLRTAQIHPIKILIPMITFYEEAIQIKRKIIEIKKGLEKVYKKPFSIPPLGIMIETPAILWQVENIALEFDFFSIGSNDLIQYIYITNRDNEKTNSYSQLFHPVTIKIIDRIKKDCLKYKKELNICGEIASNKNFIPLLIGLGITNISIPYSKIATVSQIINKIDSKKAKKIVKEIINLKNSLEVTKIISKHFNLF